VDLGKIDDMNNPVILEKDEDIVVDAGSFQVHDLIFVADMEFFLNDFLELVDGDFCRQLNFD
jgi:hypothetical protein